MSSGRYHVTVEQPPVEHYEHAHGNFCGLCMKTWPCQEPREPEGLKRAAVEMDRQLSRLYGAPYQVADHDLAWAWSQMRAELYPAGSGGGR